MTTAELAQRPRVGGPDGTTIVSAAVINAFYRRGSSTHSASGSP